MTGDRDARGALGRGRRGAELRPRTPLRAQLAREAAEAACRSATSASGDASAGIGHQARIDLGEPRTSGAFHRVVDVAPGLVFLQLTADPADDLSDAFEAKLDRAREVLAPPLIDISGVTLD